MSYRINFTDTLANPTGIIVQDQSLNTTDTDLVFVGKNFPGYSQYLGENFLHLLENFAKNAPPSKPVKGQLWYDTGTTSIPAKPQLKIYDGTNWTEAGNIKKGVMQPAAENSISGDLWVDSANQQLYLYTGASWVLVGPQFNETSNTGFRAESIIDSATNTEKIVITFFIEEKRILIISKYEFVPKVRLEGFSVIRQGLTLSDEDFDLDGVMTNKFWGTSEKANALVVGNTVVAADNFLRSDTASTTAFQLNVRSSAGINIGPGLETSITSNSYGTVVHQTTPGSTIILKTTESQGTFNDALVVSADGKVGINKVPVEALDVNGNCIISGAASINDTTESTTSKNGSLVVQGGAGIDKSLNVGGNVTVAGSVTVGSLSNGVPAILIPKVSNSFDIGTANSRFNTVYTKTLEADVVKGNFVGFLSGNVSGSASKLATTISTNLTGEVISDVVAFNGTNNISLKTSINETAISSRPEVADSLASDQFLIYRASASPSLRKIDRATLFSSVGSLPAGSIVPFAGDIVPAGFLLCDGSEQSRSLYPELFGTIGFKYKSESLLTGLQTFALPDLRGRFPSGKANMDNNTLVNKQITASGVLREQVFDGATSVTLIVPNSNTVNGPFQVGRTLSGTGLDTSAGPVIVSTVHNNVPVSGLTTLIVSCRPQRALPAITDTDGTPLAITSIGITDSGGDFPPDPRLSGATELGNVGGADNLILEVNQMPQHSHNLTDKLGNQYYAINSNAGPIPEPMVANGNIKFSSGEGHLLTNSGNVVSPSPLGQPIDISNPYLTVNYIIFTGRLI